MAETKPMTKIGQTPYGDIEEHVRKAGHPDVHTCFEHWSYLWAREVLFPNADDTELMGGVIGASGEIGVDSYIIHQPTSRVVVIQSKWHYKDDKEASALIAHLKGCMDILGDPTTTGKISKNKQRINMDEDIKNHAETLSNITDTL